jgi:hypothetical protein
MKKKLILIILIIVSLLITSGCDFKKNKLSNQAENNTNNLYEVISSVKVIINNKEYTLNLEDNETARSFANLLPREFNMSELNGNEKYIYIDSSLPTNSSNPRHINSGDVMLYGNNCLVIFYKSFDTSYSYTKIGHIDDLEDLESGSITVKFEK